MREGVLQAVREEAGREEGGKEGGRAVPDAVLELPQCLYEGHALNVAQRAPELDHAHVWRLPCLIHRLAGHLEGREGGREGGRENEGKCCVGIFHGLPQRSLPPSLPPSRL